MSVTESSRPAGFDASPLPMWTMSADGTVEHVNLAWREIAGIDADVPPPVAWLQTVHPDDVACLRPLRRETAGCQATVRLRHAAGPDRWHLVHVAPGQDDGSIWIGIAIDIDARERASQALREREAHFRAVVESATDIVYTLDLDGIVTSVNPAAHRILGYTPGEMIGRSIDDTLLPPDQVGVTMEALRNKLMGDEQSTYELEVLASDGQRITLEINSRLAIDDGKPVAIHGIARDITSRKRAETWLRVLAEAGRLLAQDLDVDVRLGAAARLAVPALADWCVVDVLEQGTPRRAVVAHADPARLAVAEELQRRYPPDPNASIGPHAVLRTGQPQILSEIPEDLLVATARDEEHLRLMRSVGLRSFLCVPLNARGHTLGTLTFGSSESGRAYGPDDLAVAEALAELAALAIDNATLFRNAQAAESRYRKVFAGVADAILISGPQRHYLDANPAATELLGYSHDELLTLQIDDLIVAAPGWTDEARTRLLAEGRWHGEMKFRRKDGTVLLVEALSTIVDLPTGPVFLSAIRDVSGRHRAERMRRDFLAMVTHDLRTPLAAIKGSAQILQRRGEYRAGQISAILGASSEMQHLIDDLAEVVRHEGGSLTLRQRPVDLGALATTIAGQAQQTTQAARITVQAPETPVIGTWDPDRVGQVLSHLLANSIRFAPEDSEVSVRIEDRGEEAWLAVTDHGPGIAAEHLPRLFDPFNRADATGAGGLGLGLYVSRMLIEAHGGRIWVEPAHEHGSTFTVALPKAP